MTFTPRSLASRRSPSGIALLYPGDRATRDRADPAASRFAPLFAAFAAHGAIAVPAVYDDDFADEVRDQLLGMRAVLAWHNPIENGRTRARLDAMLRKVASAGVFVSAHPDTLLRVGTKDVLLDVRDTPFGSDVHRVGTLDQLAAALPRRLVDGARVLKQYRGQSGAGVWRIEQVGADRYALRHAQRGAVESIVGFAAVVQALAPYFENGGHMIDQAWQPRLVEGMTRAYLVGDRVAGFGHQAVNALFPPPAQGAAPPATTPRLYTGPDDPRFVTLRARLESGWIERLVACTGVARDALPLLWDLDFLRGAPVGEDRDTWMLCEVNASSVAPFPDAAIQPLVAATLERVHHGDA